MGLEKGEEPRKNNSCADIFIGLIHHPVYDKHGRIITTAVTNLDIHDLARTASVYEIRGCFIINPLQSQQYLVESIKLHWCLGAGARYNPLRKEALEKIQVTAELAEVLEKLQEKGEVKVFTVGTTARHQEKAVEFDEMRRILTEGQGRFIFLFGTGWGLTDEMLESCDYVLKPIEGVNSSYNHLPVRAAVAIALDRLFGR